MPDSRARDLYTKLEKDREPYLKRARDAAKYTIPSLAPPDGFNADSELPTPYQGLGQRGVRNLASKLLLILLPPNGTFFKLDIPPHIRESLNIPKGEVDEAFGAVEREVSRDLEASKARVSLFETLKQLTVAGNILLNFKRTGGIVPHRLQNWVCRRSPNGVPEVVVLKQMVTPMSIPEAVREAAGVVVGTDPKPVELFTVIERNDLLSRWDIWQEVKGYIPPESRGFDPLEFPSWRPVRMMAVQGEHYGRSYVEEVLGDLATYDGLSRHILEGAAAMAKLVILLRPNSVLKPDDLKKPNLSVVRGNPDDVGVVALEKSRDFQVALELSRDVKERLEFSFLLNTAIQRNAERVTAEEIRFMAGELEDALGGVYSVLAQELQLPIVQYQLHRMQLDGRLPKGLPSYVSLQITTGLQALGRGHDLTKLRGFLQDLFEIIGPEMAVRLVEMPELVKRIAAARGIETQDLLRDPEEVAAEMNQERMMAMMQELVQKAGPDVISQLTQAGIQQNQPPTK